MPGDLSKARRDLDSPDDQVVLESLQTLSSEDSTLDKAAVDAVLPKCLDKLQHHDIAIRATAMATVASIFKDEKLSLQKHAATIAKKVQQPNVLDLKAGSDNVRHYEGLHKNTCAVVTELQLYYPYELMLSFKALGLHMINCTGHKNLSISTAACEFWAKLRLPPVPSDLMENWVSVVMMKLGKLVPFLLDCMKYHEKHIAFLEEQKPGDKMSEEMAVYTNRRNFAALGFENLCNIFQGEMATAFKPFIEKRLDSEDWIETEAVVLALGAFTQAVGKAKQLGDVYPVAIPKLLDLYSHPKPLVRAILCFTMQHFINLRMKNVKDPFQTILKNTLALLKDDLCEVQEMALQALVAILAYAERDITPQLKKVTDALVKRNNSIKGKGRFAYYECIGHIFGRAQATMEEGMAKQLLNPLMEQWEGLQCEPDDENSTEVFVRLCQSLCVVAMYYGSGFKPYTNVIFSKVVPFLEKSTSRSGDEATPDEDSRMRYTVASLDLLSAMFEGQGKELSGVVLEHKMGRAVIALLQCETVHDQIHQSALASLGHLCQHCYSTVKPQFKDVMTILQRDISSDNVVVQNNALWTLAHMAANHDTHNDKLIAFAKKLKAIISSSPSDNNVAINTALALTNLARHWPDDLAKVVIKDNVFQPLCYLLQSEFPRDLEKITIFKNLCVVVTPHLKKMNKDGWQPLCTAAATLDCQDEELAQMLKTLLRDLRSQLGNAGWSKLSQLLGAQVAYALRKKYKLY